MRASSGRFSATIRPENRLRRLVLGSGLALLLVGNTVLVQQQALPHFVRAALMAAWSAYSVTELLRLFRACTRVAAYCLFEDGSIELTLVGGQRMAARYAAGSVVLSKLAWLRVRAANGRSWGELVAGNPRKNKEWRRFQVICRQIRPC